MIPTKITSSDIDYYHSARSDNLLQTWFPKITICCTSEFLDATSITELDFGTGFFAFFAHIYLFHGLITYRLGRESGQFVKLKIFCGAIKTKIGYR
jgi:hypothetical protein